MTARPEPMTGADVTEDLLEIAEEVSSVWFPDLDEKIDWDRFIDKLSSHMHHQGWEEFTDYDNPAIRKIQRHIRAFRRDSQ